MPSKFFHKHPYPPFLFTGVKKLIVGTLPPPRFTTREFKKGDIDFCYGSRNGQLWPILNEIFKLNLTYANTKNAIEERKRFLRMHEIGVCDIVDSAERDKIDASDLGMQNAKLRDMLVYLKEYDTIETILFTGGNSKNGPEYYFRRYLKEHNLKLDVISDIVPRIHQFIHPITKKQIKTVSLTAPSGAANRAIGSLQTYKDLKSANPNFNTFDFRVLQYKEHFLR